MKPPRKEGPAPEFRIVVMGGCVAGHATDDKLVLAIEWYGEYGSPESTEIILTSAEAAALRNQLSRFGDWARLRTKRAEDDSHS